MSRYRLLTFTLLSLILVFATACGGSSDDNAEATSPPAGQPSDVSPTSESSAGEGTSSSNGDEPEAFDLCALISREDVENIVGVTVGPGMSEEPAGGGGILFLGCRYEDDAITPVVTVGIIVSLNESDAEDLFEFGADQYPAVEGIGDRAYNSQPIDDITVLSGSYEISVGLYFVSEDDAAELEMARELAQLVIDRLP